MITIQNINLQVVVKGSGRAIVLLHGWGQNMYMMKFIQDHLCENYQVINLDLPGFGESDEPPVVWGIEEYAVCIHDLMNTLHIEDPIMIAHSFGARIALRYAYMYPASHLILTGAAGIQKPRSPIYYIRVFTYKLLKNLHKQVSMGSEDYRNASLIMRGVLVASVNDDVRDILHGISSETLLIWGEHDEQTPLWMGKEMVKRLPNASLVLLKHGDHFAYFHQSLQFLRIVDAYLEHGL